MRVDLINVFSELAAWLSLDLLALLEASALDKGSLCLEVGGKHLGKLSADVGEDVVGSKLKERLKSWEVSAHLDDVLEGLLSLVLEVLRALGQHVDCQEARGHVGLRQELGVVR
ncbi:MAG: hypothetical protein ACK55I_04880, partial [bacterium]